MALCTYSKDTPGISYVQAHACMHTWMHTHTPHTCWETVKGLISFVGGGNKKLWGMQGQVPHVSNLKTPFHMK